MKLLIIRHGETNLNREKRLQGCRTNSSLNETGRQQSEELGKKLTSMSIHALYSSPLNRAHETAEIISHKIGVPVTTKKELTEKDFGDLSGKTWDEIGEDIIIKDRAAVYDYTPWGGEHSDTVKARWNSFLDFVRNEHTPADTILAVTSGGIIRIAQLDILGEVTPVTNASIHEFEI